MEEIHTKVQYYNILTRIFIHIHKYCVCEKKTHKQQHQIINGT